VAPPLRRGHGRRDHRRRRGEPALPRRPLADRRARWVDGRGGVGARGVVRVHPVCAAGLDRAVSAEPGRKRGGPNQHSL
jgi:hypothetical protein